MDIGSIAAAATTLKTAADIAKAIGKLNSISEVKGKVIDLQSQILAAQSSAMAAQSEQSSMIQHISLLEEEIARIKAWDTEKERYKLTTVGDTGAVTYALQEAMSNFEPPHYLCTNCYEDGRKSILNPRINKNSFIMFVCANCGNESHTMYSHIEPEYYKNG